MTEFQPLSSLRTSSDFDSRGEQYDPLWYWYDSIGCRSYLCEVVFDLLGDECDLLGDECDLFGDECDLPGDECDLFGDECDLLGDECES
jgi:hypothetical protein